VLIGSDWIHAERAHNLGLVDRIGDLDAALAWASEIAACAPLALQYFKQHLQIADLPDAEPAYQAATERVIQSADFAEAAAARAERRTPRFSGR
jgi:enoyl-CoA hydratase